MQELRFVAVSEDGSYAILAVPGRSGRYVLPIDERLRAIANGQTSRLAQYEIEVESPLRPKEIQARIRAGETAEEIADAAGIPVERVRWFEGPVLAERAYIADQAQTASVRRAGDSGPGPRLGEIVPARLTASGADPDDAQWDSRKRGDGNWQVTLSFPSAGRVHLAEWIFDPRRRHVMPDDDNAARLSLPESELPAEPVAMPGEATVTPLAPRLGAAAGMGGGGIGIGGPGGFAGGGSGVGVRSFRPERSVIPDRSLGADRTLAAERPPALPRHGQDRPGQERPGQDQTAFREPAPAAHRDPAAYRDPIPEPAPYFDQAPQPAAYRGPEPVAYREAPPEPAPSLDPVQPYRDPVPEPAANRAPGPERPAPPRPVIFEEPEPAVIVDSLPAPVTESEPGTEPVPEPASSPELASSPEHASSPERPTAPQPEPDAQVEPVTASAPPKVSTPVDATPTAKAHAAPEALATPDAVATVPAEPPAAAEPPTVTAEPPTVTAEPPTVTAEPAADATEPAADATEPAPEPAADDQSGRPRPGGKRNAKGRRSSVPSWDEIMLGSSRQRE